MAGWHTRTAVAAIKRFNDIEPQQRRRETLESLKRVFIRESQRQPLMMVFEDLHWIDNETQSFLDGLIDSLPKTRILLVLNYRPGYSHGWSDRSTTLKFASIRYHPQAPRNCYNIYWETTKTWRR